MEACLVHAGWHKTPYSLCIIELSEVTLPESSCQYTDHEWPSYSLDLNPLDFWSWGVTKGKAYDNRPQTLADLKQNVAAYAAEVTDETWKKVEQNFCVRVKACFKRNGAHIEHVDYQKFV